MRSFEDRGGRAAEDREARFIRDIDQVRKESDEAISRVKAGKNKAIEQLNILESCNCKEYDQLKEIIDGTKISKY